MNSKTIPIQPFPLHTHEKPVILASSPILVSWNFLNLWDNKDCKATILGKKFLPHFTQQEFLQFRLFWKDRIISRKEINTILIHTNSFSPWMLRQWSVQTAWNSQFELTGIIFQTVGFVNFYPFFKCCLIHAFFASSAFATALSTDSPHVIQPGKSG